MVYSILSILWEKKSNPEHARENCKVLRVVHTQGRIFYYPHGICFRGLHIEKTVLRWNEYSFCSYMGPDQERIMDQMASRLSVRPQVSFIKTGTYKGIGKGLIGFCIYVSVGVRRFWWLYLFIYSKHFESFQASFDYVDQNGKSVYPALI